MYKRLGLIPIVLLTAFAVFFAVTCKSPSSSPGADETPAVDSVTIDPTTAHVPRNGEEGFSADVQVRGGAAQTVTWEVTGNSSEDTISEETVIVDGYLTVGSFETAATLIVTATSTFDNTKKASATVTVIDPYVPPSVTVTISPKVNVEVDKGKTKQFTVDVQAKGGAYPDVTWSLSGNSSNATTLSQTGLLKVDADETAATLTVTVTSDFDPDKFDSATVTVTEPGPPGTASVQLIIEDQGDGLEIENTGNYPPVIFKPSGTVTFEIKNPAEAGTYTWYVGDTRFEGETVTFDADDYALGVHMIRLALNINGVPWSSPDGFLRFIVSVAE